MTKIQNHSTTKTSAQQKANLREKNEQHQNLENENHLSLLVNKQQVNVEPSVGTNRCLMTDLSLDGRSVI